MTAKIALERHEEVAVIKAAKQYSEFAYQTVMILLKTGMHISVLVDPQKHGVRITDTHIIWHRPKKSGAYAETRIKIHDDIRPFVDTYFTTPHGKNRKDFYDMLRTVGDKAGLSHLRLSNMTFRHTLAVRLLEEGLPEAFVQQILNCSQATLRRAYAKITQPKIDEILDEIEW